MLPRRKSGRTNGWQIPISLETDESTQTDVGQTVLQVFGGGCAELSDKKEKELKLLELIEDGMALITPESPVLTGYQYDWAYEEECDFPPVGMESQVILVYSADDTLAECVKGYMNSDYQETYALTPVTYKLLTPETDSLFRWMTIRKGFPDGWCVYRLY